MGRDETGKWEKGIPRANRALHIGTTNTHTINAVLLQPLMQMTVYRFASITG